MKYLLIIVSLLLVGCLATTKVMHYSVDKQVTKESQYRIDELRAEQQKLEELKREIDERVAQLNKKTESSPPAAARPSPPALSLPPQLPGSLPPRPHMERPNESTGSGQPQSIPQSTPRTQSQITKQTTKSSVDTSSVVSQLYDANIVFAIPDQANVSEEITAQLIIDPLKTLEELQKSITVGPVRSAESIKIAKIVIAKLDAPDFVIISQTDPEQAIAETQSTEWLWTLRPKTAGLHPVNIVVYAEVTVGSKTTKYKLRTFDKQVMIEIKPTQVVASWWQKYWQWVFVTLLIPFGKWLYDKKFGKKEKAT